MKPLTVKRALSKPVAPMDRPEFDTTATDYAGVNATRQGGQRVDTFRTPTPNRTPTSALGSACPPSPRRQLATGDARDLLEACEPGITESLCNVFREMRDVREDVRTVIGSFRREIKGNVEVLLSASGLMSTMMKEVHAKVDDVYRMHTEESLNVDFTVVLDDIRKSTECQVEATQRWGGQLAEKLAEFQDEFTAAQDQGSENRQSDNDAASASHAKVLSTLTDLECNVHAKFDEVSGIQKELTESSAQTSRRLQRLHQDSARHHINFEPCIKAQFNAQDRSMNAYLSRVVSNIQDSYKAAGTHFVRVLQEIARIQRSLGVDYPSHLITGRAITMVAAVQFSQPLPGTVGGSAEIIEQSDHSHDQGHGDESLSFLTQDEKRARDIGMQTDCGMVDGWAQTEEVKRKPPPNPFKKQLRADDKNRKRPGEVFTDAAAMKLKAREALLKPQYNVFDHYHASGIFQKIGKSHIFESMTFLVIFTNAIWISIDIDLNDADLLLDAHLVFQIAENCFCTYFTAELFIRFMAFKKKSRCFKDFWFVFDLVLVFIMILETWVLTVTLLALGKGTAGLNLKRFNLLRMIRMIKILRMARMARLLRMIPEIVILMKGIGVAVRSVLVFLMLWLVMIYIYAVVFRQLTNDSNDIKKRYFESVPAAMNTLLLDGLMTFNTQIMNDVMDVHPLLFVLLLSFTLLAVLTVMNMLVGVLVEVVAAVASTEKENMTVSFVSTEMRKTMSGLRAGDLSTPLTKEEFVQYLVEPDIASILRDNKVDIAVLVDMAEVIYEDLDEGATGLTFEKFVDIVLNMRGTNPVTVKDVKEQLRVLKAVVHESSNHVLDKVEEEFVHLRGFMMYGGMPGNDHLGRGGSIVAMNTM